MVQRVNLGGLTFLGFTIVQGAASVDSAGVASGRVWMRGPKGFSAVVGVKAFAPDEFGTPHVVLANDDDIALDGVVKIVRQKVNGVVFDTEYISNPSIVALVIDGNAVEIPVE